MDIKLTILFCTIAAIVVLSHLTQPTGLERYVTVRLRRGRAAP